MVKSFRNKQGRILVIGLPYSIHTTRWVNQISKLGYTVHFFSSVSYIDYSDTFSDEIIIHANKYQVLNRDNSILSRLNFRPINFLFGTFYFKSQKLNRIYSYFLRLLRLEKSHLDNLKLIINRVTPKIVHTLESQNAGYLMTNYLLETNNSDFKWCHTLYGSDLFYFQYLPDHKVKLVNMLSKISHLIIEGNRDRKLAQDLEFRGQISIIQATGSLEETDFIQDSQILSKKNIILIRARQDEARRGLVAIRALERSNILQNSVFEFHFYDITSEVDREIAYLMVQYPTVKFIKHGSLKRNEFIELLKSAKYHVAISRSDGMPNTLIESMACGVLPIQSKYSLAEELISDEKNGFIVGSDDTDEIALVFNKLPIKNQLFEGIIRNNIETIRIFLTNQNIIERIRKIYQ